MLRKALYNLKWRRYHPTAFARFEELMRNERLPLGELMAKQEIARQKIVCHAMEHTAFYKKFYGDVGFEIGDIGKDGWFERLPIVTKKELREHFDEFVDPDQRQFLKISTTGGSTGTPTKTGYDGRIPEEVYSWRLQSRFGVYPWDDHAYVWRDTRQSRMAKLKNAVQWWPTRHLKLDATFMTDESIRRFLKKCAKVRPALLQGYVGAVSQVADFINTEAQRHRDVLGGWRPKVVWTTSAPLSVVKRRLIEAAFKAPVCDEYGSCECRWLACQCPECKGLHVNIEHVHIEFVDDSNRPISPHPPLSPSHLPTLPPSYGRTLITNLEDTVFPLIRYENGDRGRWLTEPCACGRTLPCIDSVKGREVESFVLPSGKTINGEYLTTIFDAVPDLVRGFRVVQHKDLSITVEVVRGGEGEMVRGGEGEMVERVVRGFAEKIGGEVKVDCKFVDEIPHDRGKIRYVVRER